MLIVFDYDGNYIDNCGITPGNPAGQAERYNWVTIRKIG